jgi:hypothetical protein
LLTEGARAFPDEGADDLKLLYSFIIELYNLNAAEEKI